MLYEVITTFDINYKDKAEYLTFPAFTNSGLVRHLFSTRTGGYSEGIFASMNLGLNRGDAQENVIKNFNKIADILNCSIEEFVFSDQTHLDQVRVITKEDAGKGITRKKDFFDTDGMITNEPGIILATFYADRITSYNVCYTKLLRAHINPELFYLTNLIWQILLQIKNGKHFLKHRELMFLKSTQKVVRVLNRYRA